MRPEAYEVGFTSRRKRGGRKSLRVAGQQAGTSEGVVKKGKRGIGAGKRTAEEMEKVAEREDKMWKRGAVTALPLSSSS